MIVKFNDCAISLVDFRKNSTCSQVYVQSNGSLHDCRDPCLLFAFHVPNRMEKVF